MKLIQLKDNATGSEHTFSIPESWDDVTWAQYLDYTLMSKFEYKSNYELAMAQLSALTSLPLDTLRDTGHELVLTLLDLLSFRTTVPTPAPIAHVRIGSDLYYAQKLDVMLELAVYDRVMGEPGLIEEKIPKLLSILLRKRLTVTRTVPRKSFWGKLLRRQETQQIETQEPEPFRGYVEVMEERARLFTNTLSVTQVQALATFFLSSGQPSQRLTLHFSSLLPRLTRQTKSLERVYHAIMGGTRPFGALTPILWKSLRCYFSLLDKYLLGLNTIKK